MKGREAEEDRQMMRLAAMVANGAITDQDSIQRVAAWRERNRQQEEEKKRLREEKKQARRRVLDAGLIEEPEPPPPEPPPPPVQDVIDDDFAGATTLTDRQKLRLLELIVELKDRQEETLRLYKPMPIQKDFHDSDAHIRIIRGGNRSGKTTASMCELAWALCGTHPIEGRYRREGLRAIVVAKDNDKIGQVIWRLLGRPGAFKMCEDPATGLTRLEQPGDKELGIKLRPAPPLIPKRLIQTIQWVSLKAQQPKSLVLKNTNECSFYSSEADPFSIQGTQLDLAIFDEEVKNEGWFHEAIARLVDRGGHFVWGVTPQAGTQKLYDLSQKALEDQEINTEHPLVEEFVVSIRDNPYLTAEDKAMFIMSLDDEEQILIRVEGEHAISGYQIYKPYFFPRGIHGVEPFPLPHEWTYFAAIDPGAQVTAVLFGCCPPKRKPSDSPLDPALFGDYVYLFDEIHIKRSDATKLANEMRDHVGDLDLHTILIDHHGGQLTEIGSGKTPEQQYKEAFQRARIRVPMVGRYFTWGSDDLSGGILKVKDILRPRADGTPRLKVLRDRVPHLVSALNRYQWKVVNGLPTDKPLARNCDMADCLRYIAMHAGVRYHPPDGNSKRIHKTSYEKFKEYQRRELKRTKKKQGISL